MCVSKGHHLNSRGVRLELHKPLNYELYFDLNPYAWRGKEDRFEVGGAVFRLGWTDNTFGIAFMHNSEHNFDRKTNDSIEFDAIEARWKLN